MEQTNNNLASIGRPTTSTTSANVAKVLGKPIDFTSTQNLQKLLSRFEEQSKLLGEQIK